MGSTLTHLDHARSARRAASAQVTGSRTITSAWFGGVQQPILALEEDAADLLDHAVEVVDPPQPRASRRARAWNRRCRRPARRASSSRRRARGCRRAGRCPRSRSGLQGVLPDHEGEAEEEDGRPRRCCSRKSQQRRRRRGACRRRARRGGRGRTAASRGCRPARAEGACGPARRSACRARSSGSRAGPEQVRHDPGERRGSGGRPTRGRGQIRLTCWPVVPLEVSVLKTSASGTLRSSCDLNRPTGRIRHVGERAPSRRRAEDQASGAAYGGAARCGGGPSARRSPASSSVSFSAHHDPVLRPRRARSSVVTGWSSWSTAQRLIVDLAGDRRSGSRFERRGRRAPGQAEAARRQLRRAASRRRRRRLLAEHIRALLARRRRPPRPCPATRRPRRRRG